jgi:microcystin-dependent protein
MANNPELLKMPLARDGQKNTIPETAIASAGIFSQQYGWQSINSLPPQAGGKAVKREDFNGAFNLLGGIAYYAQKGFTFKWSAEQDYYAGCVVIDDTDGLRYECIADVTANSTSPSADATHWQIFSAMSDLDPWFRQESTAYNVDDMRCNESLPYGWYLLCTTAGTTSASDLVITSPTVGDTVTDGGVVWTIDKIGKGSKSGGGTPTGTIIEYASNGALPDGYLSCDGSAVSRTTYADLFAAIGTTWGSGDGSTTFNLPSLNGYWLKGSSTAGSSVSAGLPNITGELSYQPNCGMYHGGTISGAFTEGPEYNNSISVSSSVRTKGLIFKASSSNSIYGSSSTVSVSSKTVRYIIKY